MVRDDFSEVTYSVYLYICGCGVLKLLASVALGEVMFLIVLTCCLYLSVRLFVSKIIGENFTIAVLVNFSLTRSPVADRLCLLILEPKLWWNKNVRIWRCEWLCALCIGSVCQAAAPCSVLTFYYCKMQMLMQKLGCGCCAIHCLFHIVSGSKFIKVWQVQLLQFNKKLSCRLCYNKINDEKSVPNHNTSH